MWRLKENLVESELSAGTRVERSNGEKTHGDKQIDGICHDTRPLNGISHCDRTQRVSSRRSEPGETLGTAPDLRILYRKRRAESEGFRKCL